MALKPQSGLSLVELVAALSLSALVAALALALFRDVGSAARLLRGGRDDAFEARTVFRSLCDNLMAGGGLLSLEPGRARVLNRAGERLEYAWSDSTLTVNGRPAGMRLAALEIVPGGPVLPSGDEWTRERMEFAAADSLDEDRDGTIDADELDRDGDDELEPWECQWVGVITLRMTTVRSGHATTLVAVVHPRNRVRDWTGWSGDASDDLPGIGDFGR